MDDLQRASNLILFRWIFRILQRAIFMVLLCGFSIGCTDNVERDRREFMAIERAIEKLLLPKASSRADDGADFETKLQRVEEMPAHNKDVEEAKTLCVNAYQSYGSAQAQISRTQSMVGMLEKALTAPVTDREAAVKKHAAASAMVAQIDADLENARRYIDKCTHARRRLMDKLQVIGP